MAAGGGACPVAESAPGRHPAVQASRPGRAARGPGGEASSSAGRRGFVYTYSQCADLVPAAVVRFAGGAPGGVALGVTALGGPSGSRASVGMAGGECRQRARARYHHSAERSSRRPSPRGAGGRVVQWIWGGWGAPRVLRLGRPGGAFLARARVRYHYPAERSSRRPSPRGAGGRAVRLQPLMHQWARRAGQVELGRACQPARSSRPWRRVG
jgi:hypothetical protein